MNEDFIKFDFANGKIEVRSSGEQGIIEMPDLADKRAAVYAAAGLELINGAELRTEARALFQSLGLDVE